MSPLEVRFEDISGRMSLIVTANLAEGWRRLGNNFGFYAFAHEKFQENEQVSVRVWVIENPSQSYRAQDGFPLDLQSMGSSASRALAFRLFNGRLSLGTAVSTVLNCRQGNGHPGFYKEAVLIAQHRGVAYWLRFYAAINDENPEMPEWTEQDFALNDEGALPALGQLLELPISNVEERLARVTSALNALEERVAVLAKDIQARLEGSLQGSAEVGSNSAEDIKKAAEELGPRLSQQVEKQAEAAMEKLRQELNNTVRAVEEGQRQLASLVEAKQASLNQVAASAVASLEAERKQLEDQRESTRRELEELSTRRSAKLLPSPGEHRIRARRLGIGASLALGAGLFLAVTVPPLGVMLSTPPPVRLHLQADAPADFADQSPYWNPKHRAREVEMARAYWQAAVASLQGKYAFGSELPADPPAGFQVDTQYAPPGGPKALAESRAHYWGKFRASWGQRQFWVEGQPENESWTARLRRVWEQIKAKLA